MTREASRTTPLSRRGPGGRQGPGSLLERGPVVQDPSREGPCALARGVSSLFTLGYDSEETIIIIIIMKISFTHSIFLSICKYFY